MFKITNVNPNVYNKRWRKKVPTSKIFDILFEFCSSDAECIQIEYPVGQYSSPYNCAKSFKNAIIRYGFAGRLECFVRNEVTYIRKLV